MAALATQDINYTGLAPAYAAAAGGGDTFTPDADTILHAKNGSGGAITVTIVTPGTGVGGVAISDVAVSVPAGGERMIGPFPAQHFADPTTGQAAVTYSGVTSLTIAALRARTPAGA